MRKKIIVAAALFAAILWAVNVNAVDINSHNKTIDGGDADAYSNSDSSSQSRSSSDADSSSRSGVKSDNQSSGQASASLHEGDTEVVSVDWPNSPSTEGKAESSVYTLFGGINSNVSEEHVRIQHQMQIAIKAHEFGALSDDEMKAELKALYQQIKASNRAPKLIGILPIAQRGCSVLNVCRLLLW
jgi:hypothetical protein